MNSGSIRAKMGNMLKQATVEDVAHRRITKLHGKIVVVTQYYPRFLKRNLIHDYVRALAPTRALLTEFKASEKAQGDHDLGFESVDYESKFSLDQAGLAALRELSEAARSGDVYLVCHCRLGQRCHRELLLIAAHTLFHAPVARVYLEYPAFRKRVEGGHLVVGE